MSRVISRRIIYIRATHLPDLFVRFRERCYFPVIRILTPEQVPWNGLTIAVGDLLDVQVGTRTIRMDVGEDTDFTDEPKLVAASRSNQA